MLHIKHFARPLFSVPLGGLLLCLMTPLSAAAPLDGVTPVPQGMLETWAGRIHIAGRQRTLSQRMTKTICFSLLGIEPEKNARQADAAAVEFDARMDSLLLHPLPFSNAPEAAPQMRARLKDVLYKSRGLTASVRQIAAGDVHSVAMKLVLERNDLTLRDMDHAMRIMVKKAVPSLPPIAARTLNEAGRQRTLIQKMAKDVCLIAAGLHTTKSRVSLKFDFTYFSAVHEALLARTEAAHFERPPSPEIKAALRSVDALWVMMRPQIQSVIEGDPPTTQTLQAVSNLSDGILTRMNRVVTLWAAHHS